MRLLIPIILIALGWHYFASPKARVQQSSGGEITVSRNGVDATLAAGESLDETWMLFGADPGIVFGDAFFSGLPINTARSLSARYPDLGRCDSASSPELHSSLQRVNLIAADPAAEGVFREARSDYARRLNSNSERLCLAVQGRRMNVKQLEAGGSPMTFDDSILSGHYLIDRARLIDCAAAM